MASGLRKRIRTQETADNDNAETASAARQHSDIAHGDDFIPSSGSAAGYTVVRSPVSLTSAQGALPRNSIAQFHGSQGNYGLISRRNDLHGFSPNQSLPITTSVPAAPWVRDNANDHFVGHFQQAKQINLQGELDGTRRPYSLRSMGGSHSLNHLQQTPQIVLPNFVHGSSVPSLSHPGLQASLASAMTGPAVPSSQPIALPTVNTTVATSHAAAAQPITSYLHQAPSAGSQFVIHPAAALTIHANIAAARTHLNQMQWHAPRPLTSPNVDQLYRDIRTAAHDYTNYIDKPRTITRLSRGRVSGAEIDMVCWHIVDVLLNLHNSNVGTKNRKKADPTDVPINRAERSWVMEKRKMLICEALRHCKKLLLDIIDKPHDVEYLLVLAPSFALSKRRRDMEGNNKRGEKTQQLLQGNAQQATQLVQASLPQPVQLFQAAVAQTTHLPQVHPQQTTHENADEDEDEDEDDDESEDGEEDDAPKATQAPQLGVPIQPNGYTAFASHGQEVPHRDPRYGQSVGYEQQGTAVPRTHLAYDNGVAYPSAGAAVPQWDGHYGAQPIGQVPVPDQGSLLANPFLSQQHD